MRLSSRLAFGLFGAAALLSGCTKDDPAIEEGKAVQRDMRRAIGTVKSLGRFGLYALFNEDMAAIPCEPPLSPSNRVCTVHVLGRGTIRLTVADAALAAAANVPADGVVKIEYPADCANERFDFKSLDNGLPRRGEVGAAIHVWEDKLVVVTHERRGEGKDATCTVTVAPTPAFLARLAKPGLFAR